MGWKDLSIRDKAAIIRQSVSNGIYNLGEIRNRFDKDLENFRDNDANFVERLRSNDTRYIQNEDGSKSTHRLGYFTEGNSAVIYPEIQDNNGNLEYGTIDSAIERGDTVRTSIPFAKYYTENYKKDYPEFFNRFDEGGDKNTINHQKYNAEQVNPMYDYLRESGLTNEQASGLLGNLAVESYLNADMKQVNGPAYGLMQAEGARKKAMLAYNRTPYSFGSGLSPEEQQQLDYIIDKGIQNYTPGEWGKSGFNGARHARNAFLNAKTTRMASDIITNNFLRPGKPNLNRRRVMSDYYYNTQKERIPYQIESWSNILKSWEQ